MISRTWQGRVPTARADEYFEYLQRTGLSDYRATPGNRGVLVLRRDEGRETHFVLITLWDSLDAIKRFAGEDYEVARYYPEDDEFLLEKEPGVTHAEVIMGVVSYQPSVVSIAQSGINHHAPGGAEPSDN